MLKEQELRFVRIGVLTRSGAAATRKGQMNYDTPQERYRLEIRARVGPNPTAPQVTCML